MRIGIDIRTLIFTQAGISNYTYNLIKALARVDREDEYFLFCNTKSRYDWSRYDNVSEKVLRLPSLGSFTTKIWEDVLLPRGLSSMKIDIFHSPRFMLPTRKPCRFVVTIHDLAFKKFPQFVTKKAFSYFNAHVQSAIKIADKIIVDSYNTKEDLINLFGVHRDRIEVIYAGIDEDYHVIEDKKVLEEVKDKYSLPEKFILFVGTIEPRKNLIRLLEGYHKLSERRAIEHSLVIAGRRGWLCEDIFEAVERLNLSQRVIFTGYIAKEDLPKIYNLGDLFVFLSLYEGFGLPPLEAMACGIPVVSSNSPSLPEVLGDAAILVDPYDVEDIAKEIERVLENGGLRKEMINKGLKHREKFSWQDSAKKTLMAYRKIE